MTEPTTKSTVRNRKKDPRAAIQRYLPVAEIRNDTAMLKNGGMRAILEVEALNFNLKSETEQQGIIAGYGGFVNTLNFPLQVVIRSTKMNVDDYVDDMKERADKQQNELLKEQTEAYANFMQRLVEVADIMQKKFYVIIPVDRSERKKTMFEQLFEWINPDDSTAKTAQRAHDFAQGSRQLNERVELVSSGLGNIGLHIRRLNTRELITLFYQIYNPKTSQRQKMPADMGALEMNQTNL